MCHSTMILFLSKGNFAPLHRGPHLQLNRCQSSVTGLLTCNQALSLSRFTGFLCLPVSRIHLMEKQQNNFLGFSQISKGWPFFLGKRLSSPPKKLNGKRSVRVRMEPSVRTAVSHSNKSRPAEAVLWLRTQTTQREAGNSPTRPDINTGGRQAHYVSPTV